ERLIPFAGPIRQMFRKHARQNQPYPIRQTGAVLGADRAVFEMVAHVGKGFRLVRAEGEETGRNRGQEQEGCRSHEIYLWAAVASANGAGANTEKICRSISSREANRLSS